MQLHKVSYLLGTLLCFCWLRSVTSSCIKDTLHITADNKLSEVYINGDQKSYLPNADDWKKADSVVLPCNTVVIAVKAINLGDMGGILASTDNGYILTNHTWKCTSTYYEGWHQIGFNDSSWLPAHKVAIHETDPWSLVPGIRKDAYWIWTKSYKGGDSVVYCRKELVPHVPPTTTPLPCPSQKLSATVDNKMILYIDGIEKTGLQNANDWKKADTVELLSTARVIAIQGTNDGDVAGILASTDDGYILTNSSWKCTNTYHEGWQLIVFDDSSWPSAHEVALHETDPWSLVPGIRKDAYWIWTKSYKGGDLVVYCRKTLVERRPCY